MPTTSYKLQAARHACSRATVTSSKGFTLIEVVVSVFIFSIIMLAVSQTFIAAFGGYNDTKTVQRDLEAAQFAMNILAKELRTSSIVSADAPTGTKVIKFYDHSQGRCFQYNIDTVARILQTRWMSVPVAPSGVQEDVWKTDYCSANAISGGYTTAATGVNDGAFIVRKSTKSPSLSLGKVTVSLEIGEDANHTARIQTTSSLRDYGYIGL